MTGLLERSISRLAAINSRLTADNSRFGPLEENCHKALIWRAVSSAQTVHITQNRKNSWFHGKNREVMAFACCERMLLSSWRAEKAGAGDGREDDPHR
jgi:hypothetical protein